ncbi:MAG: energy-coupling factor ABC transporter permease [Oscillospiraceae bacterium]|nr:energy-coupling factor ABC transporter permease [Oscillospiraceae bacterium]
MHMADALLSPAVGMAMNVVSAATIGVSVAKVSKNEISEKLVPIMGVSGALVFAGQMINFTIPATGSSGHIGGGILLAGLLGGIPAFLSITVVLIIQCLFFADGGLLALGSNIFNLGVIPCLFVYPLIFKPLLKKTTSNKMLSLASILSVVIALELGAFFVVMQTLFSRIAELPFNVFITLMLPIHLVIGIIEGLITAAILSFVYKMRPEIVDYSTQNEQTKSVSIRNLTIALAAMAIVVGGVFSLFASTQPDGLEWAIGRTTEQVYGEEVELEAEGSVYDTASSIQEKTAFLPDYSFASDTDNSIGTSLSGIIGAAITFALASGTGFVITFAKKRSKEKWNVSA